MTRKTGGGIKIEMHFSLAVAKSAETFDAAATGKRIGLNNQSADQKL